MWTLFDYNQWFPKWGISNQIQNSCKLIDVISIVVFVEIENYCSKNILFTYFCVHILGSWECRFQTLSLMRPSSSLRNPNKRSKIARRFIQSHSKNNFKNNSNLDILKMFFSLMQLLGLIVIINLANVQGCRFDMEFNERVRVCSQCKNKEVVGKYHSKSLCKPSNFTSRDWFVIF